jgi:hypothetical protein
MWGALSDERTGLSLTIAAGTRQRSHFWVRVPWDSWPYFTVSDSRLPFCSPPTTRRATAEASDPASKQGCLNEICSHNTGIEEYCLRGYEINKCIRHCKPELLNGLSPEECVLWSPRLDSFNLSQSGRNWAGSFALFLTQLFVYLFYYTVCENWLWLSVEFYSSGGFHGAMLNYLSTK